MYKAGIIGTGYIGTKANDSHLEAYADCDDIQLRSLQDKGFKLKDLEGCEILSVCTPPETHLGIVAEIIQLESLKAIYLEKPIATTLSDAQKIINLCRDANILLVVNHQRQFINPKFTFSRGILHTGTHVFDLIRKLFGEIVVLTKDYCTTVNGITVELEYRDTDERYFDLDCTRSKERMILKGVEHIVKCLDEVNINQDSGISAERDLMLCLAYEGLFNAKRD